MNRAKFQLYSISFYKLIAIIGVVVGLSYHIALWRLTPEGTSFVTSTTPYWDFNNLWVGARLAITGQVDLLFDVDAYRAAMDQIFAVDVPGSEWSYPPNMLLVGAPLALLPVFVAYWIWTLGSLLLLHLALRNFRLPPLLHLAALFSPVVFMNAIFGQNGTFISALLLLGLYNIPKKPLLAGLCFGLMTVKPHYGLLLPFILISGGHWKAFLSAALSAIAMFLVTGLAFGFDAWYGFLTYTQPFMTGILEVEPYHPYQATASALFVCIRFLGGSLQLAYSLQIVLSLLILGFTIWLWRPERKISHIERVAITCFLVLLASPYSYFYDWVAAWSAIVLIISQRQRLAGQPLFAIIWLYPVFAHMISWRYHVNFHVIIPATALILLWLSVQTQPKKHVRI